MAGALSSSLLPVVMGACGERAQTGVAAGPSGAASTVAAGSASPGAATAGSTGFPTYLPTANKPKPDFPGASLLYEDGYVNYPANPVKAVAETPGLGGDVKIFVQPLQPPFAPLDKNPAWQEINKQLNANVQFILAPPADYPAKLGTLMAGGDLPDLMEFYGGVYAVPNIPKFFEAACADLSPYLAGDAAKSYPNLASIPTFAWKNSGSMYDGHLYFVPIERPSPGLQLYRDISIYDKEIGAGYIPKNADDFKRVLKELTRPSEGRYATGSHQGVAYDVDYYKSVFGAPNNWRLDSSGKLTKDFETPEYRETVGYLRDLVAAGYFHPNTPTYSSITQSTVDYTTGKWVLYVNSFAVSWGQIWRYGLQRKPPVDYGVVYPWSAHDGVKPVHHFGQGFQAATALKKASPERVKELLRILNWLAAPFGSQEDLLLTSGIKDADYKLDGNGNPILTERGNLDANNVPWKYVVQHPQVMYTPDISGLSKAQYEAEQAEIPVGVADPTLGAYSATFSAKGVTLTKAFMDGVNDVIAGRQPLTVFDTVVKDWQTNGGNQIRTEFVKSLTGK